MHLRSPTKVASGETEPVHILIHRVATAASPMADFDSHSNTERYGGSLLQWTNRIDAAGSRIEWRITTDHEGWVSRYGPVHNAGVFFGSKAVSSTLDEKMLLAELRERMQIMDGVPSAYRRPSEPLAA